MHKKPRWIEYALLLLLATLWGSSYLFIKLALESVPAITLIAARVMLACLFLGVVMRWQQVSLPRDTQMWRLLFLQSLLNATGAWLLLTWGQQYIDSGLAGVLNSTSPLFVVLITVFISRHEAVTPLKILGVVIGFTGVVFIIGLGALEELGQQVLAQLAAVGGAMLYACAAINGKKFKGHPPVVTATGTLLCAAAVLVPASLIIDKPWQLTPTSSSVMSVVALALFSTAGAFLLYFRLLDTLGSLRVASQAYLRAAISVLLGVAILGEQLTPTITVGIACALGGVALINLTSINSGHPK